MSKKNISADLPKNHLVVFQERSIRRTWHNAEWWFSVVDVCGVLTESADHGAYWRKLKQRLGAEGGEVVTFCHGLKLEAPDGKQRMTDCANTEGLFRIIQSIPSPKAVPFKRWLAQAGYESVKEIENPELASASELYQAKGYPLAWIEKRLRSIRRSPAAKMRSGSARTATLRGRVARWPPTTNRASWHGAAPAPSGHHRFAW